MSAPTNHAAARDGFGIEPFVAVMASRTRTWEVTSSDLMTGEESADSGAPKTT